MFNGKILGRVHIFSRVLENKVAPLKYIKLIKDMYDRVITSVRTS